MTHPIDNLVRMNLAPIEMRAKAADESNGSTLFGHFAVYDTWTEIKSWWEGD